MSAAATTAGDARGGSQSVIASEAKQSIFPHARIDGLLRRFVPLRKRFAFVAGNDDRQESAGFTTGTGCFGPQRVSITLTHDSTPSNTMEAAASLKKSCAVALCVDSHQPPAPIKNNRAVCASTGPIILAAPCDEK